MKRKSSTEGTTSSNCSRVTESLGRSPDTTVHDNSDKNINSDAESEREYDDSPGEVSDLITSVDSSKNLSLSSNSHTISKTVPGSLTDNSRLTLTNTMNESQCTSLSDTDLPADNTVDTTILPSTNISDVSNKSSNSNVGTCVHDDSDQLGSSTKSIDSQERCFGSLLLAASPSLNAMNPLCERVDCGETPVIERLLFQDLVWGR